MIPPTYDCRLELFRERGSEVLSSVVQGLQVVQPDPFDVEEIYAGARREFEETLLRVSADARSRILLIRGEAGCGKTHLIRSLRAQTHARQQGIVVYVQMTSDVPDYRLYLLRQVVKSLGDPYLPSTGSQQQLTALDLLSDSLVQLLPDPQAADLLYDADEATLARLVTDYADALSDLIDKCNAPRFGDVELNTLRIFLYRQSAQRSVGRRVSDFLNGNNLSELDWQKISAMPRDCSREPLHQLGQIARLIAAATGVPLILCVDQIENSDITGRNHEPFVRAMSTACELIEVVPSTLVVLSCLNSAYAAHSPSLYASFRHRIEHDPSPIELTAARSEVEIRKILSRRLSWLYAQEGLEHVPADSVYPLPETLPNQLANQQVRIVLQQVRAYWEKCHRTPEGALPEWEQSDSPTVPTQSSQSELDRLRVAWNEFSISSDNTPPEQEDAQFQLLLWALEAVQAELDQPATISLTRRGEFSAALMIGLPRSLVLRRLVGVCDKAAPGGGLERQIKSLESDRQEGENIVVLRSTAFPRSGKAVERLRAMEALGDRHVTMEESAWKALHAMRRFLKLRGAGFSDATLQSWRSMDKPLASVPGIEAIVAPPKHASVNPVQAAVEKIESRSIVLPSTKPVPPPEAPIPRALAQSDEIVIGKSDGFAPRDVVLNVQSLTRHTAIFGANGSGKTVLAVGIVEMLLERGISCILFDRKGDLASYATQEAWQESTGAPDENARRPALRDKVDFHLYTPGAAAGRALSLRLLPSSLGKMSEPDREDEARQAATILCEICDPGRTKADMFATVLTKAVDLLCDADDRGTLDELQDLLLNPPQELLAMLPAHGEKDCIAVGRRLNERRTAHGRLFNDQGEMVNLSEMLLGSLPGRARLNIISTQFLDADSASIWMAQFLGEVGRFILKSPSPAGELQALLMFDEADQYIPANRKPATKAGMENLLRRARAAGVGIMLATQNSGDFDYKALDNITTVLAGKLTTPRALDKLRSRLGELTDRLAKKAAGQFIMAVQDQVTEIKSHMSLLIPRQVPREEIERLAADQAQRSS